MSDLISRQFEEIVVEYPNITDEEHKGKPYYSIKYIENGEDKIIGFGTYKIEVLSRYIRDYFIQSVQLDRDIAIKPIETTDRAWGIPNKQAVCPKCDYYLSHISFLGDYKGKRITYCETCGQAIDWEGWDWDE